MFYPTPESGARKIRHQIVWQTRQKPTPVFWRRFLERVSWALVGSGWSEVSRLRVLLSPGGLHVVEPVRAMSVRLGTVARSSERRQKSMWNVAVFQASRGTGISPTLLCLAWMERSDSRLPFGGNKRIHRFLDHFTCERGMGDVDLVLVLWCDSCLPCCRR